MQNQLKISRFRTRIRACRAVARSAKAGPTVVENMFKKKLKKMLTPARLSGILVSHTVTTEQQHKIK
jgi:hypothetical protein